MDVNEMMIKAERLIELSENTGNAIDSSALLKSIAYNFCVLSSYLDDIIVRLDTLNDIQEELKQFTDPRPKGYCR